jgi:hypothetical protein
MDAPSPSRRRVWTFRIVTGLTIVLLLFALPNVLAPWLDINLDPSIQHPDLARWHKAVEGSGDAAALTLLALLLWPRRYPSMVLGMVVSAVVASALVLPFTGPSLLFILAPVLLVIGTYPYWTVVRGMGSVIRLHRGMLAVAVVGAAALLPQVISSLSAQIAGAPEAVAGNQGATYAEHITSLVLGCFLAATRLPGWRLGTGVLAARLVYLGVVAIVFPDLPDSWGVVGGIAAVAAGAVVGMAVARGSDPAGEELGRPAPVAVPAADHGLQPAE